MRWVEEGFGHWGKGRCRKGETRDASLETWPEPCKSLRNSFYRFGTEVQHAGLWLAEHRSRMCPKSVR